MRQNGKYPLISISHNDFFSSFSEKINFYNIWMVMLRRKCTFATFVVRDYFTLFERFHDQMVLNDLERPFVKDLTSLMPKEVKNGLFWIWFLGKRFQFKTSLVHHLNCHSENPRFKCQFCGKILSGKNFKSNVLFRVKK